MAALIGIRSLEKACVPVLFSLETLIRRKNPLTICFKKLTFKSAFASRRVSYFAALETGSAFRQGFPNFLTQQSHLEHFSTETETLDLEDTQCYRSGQSGEAGTGRGAGTGMV